MREVVKKSGRKPEEEYALHSPRIGSNSMLAAGDVSERAIQREER